MNSFPSPDCNLNTHDTTPSERFLVAVIGPDDAKRESVVRTLDEFPQVEVFEFYSYPPKRGYLRDVLKNPFSVVMIELDSAPENVLDLIEEATESSSAEIVVYSAKADLTLALRCIDAGASDYLRLPLDPAAFSSQLDRLALEYRTALAACSTNSASEMIPAGASALNCATFEEHRPDLPLLIPETLPENFRDWDAEPCPVLADGTPVEMETARVLSAVSVEHSIEQEAVLPPEWDWSQFTHSASNDMAMIAEEQNTRTNTSGVISCSFVERTENESGAFIEIPVAEFQHEYAIPGKKCRITELGAAITQESDEALFQMFRSNVESSRRPGTLKKQTRIAAPIVISIVLPLLAVTIGLLNPRVDSDAKQLVSLCAHSIQMQFNSEAR